MSICSTCKHNSYCEAVKNGCSDQVKGCMSHRVMEETKQTNEEWFIGLSAEEKAELIIYKGFTTKWRWVDWFKSVHKD